MDTEIDLEGVAGKEARGGGDAGESKRSEIANRGPDS